LFGVSVVGFTRSADAQGAERWLLREVEILDSGVGLRYARNG
jgi:hypothetical protein